MADDKHRVATPEQLAAYAARAKYVFEMAVDAGAGTAYLVCKRSRLELDTVIAVDFRQLAALAITYIQIAQTIRDEAAKIQVVRDDGRMQ